MIPKINKPTRVTKYTATAIDNIITNCIINSDFKSAIVKKDLSDHFPIILLMSLCESLPLRMIWKTEYISEILLKTQLITLNRHYLKQLGIV